MSHSSRSTGGHAQHGAAALAHHFETPQQQESTAKLGMWVFLSTEILMFGGLFCAYAVYRANNPDVFAYAHHSLDRTLGAVNTLVLLASSLTMAWAVRCSQLGQTRGLVWCLALTLAGGLGFMAIKSVEYAHKWESGKWVGAANRYHPEFDGRARADSGGAKVAVAAELPPTWEEGEARNAAGWPIPPDSPRPMSSAPRSDGTVSEVATVEAPEAPELKDLSAADQRRVHIFYQIYFLMTGLHGLHVLIGMGLIAWILVRAARGAFGPAYNTPVDCVGLYWHLVDLIWIYLFPLLYLIH